MITLTRSEVCAPPSSPFPDGAHAIMGIQCRLLSSAEFVHHKAGVPEVCEPTQSALQGGCEECTWTASDSRCTVFAPGFIAETTLRSYTCDVCNQCVSPDGAECFLLLKDTWASAAFCGMFPEWTCLRLEFDPHWWG